MNAEEQQSRGGWAPLIMHHKCTSVLDRRQALSQVRTAWKQKFRAFMSARGTDDGRSSASQLLLHLLGLPVQNESLLMAGSRCQRRPFLSFHHRSCHIASTWSRSDPPYMNLQLCPSGWIQRWCTEAWLILRYSTFYEQEKLKEWPHETSSRWASATRPKAVSCSRRRMIEHDNRWIMMKCGKSLPFDQFPKADD